MNIKELYIKGIKIDPNIFTFKFGCRCNGECCHYGVYTDLKEHQNILAIKDRIIPLMDETQSTNISDWFEPAEEDDDFESGVAVGTEIVNEKCVFLDKNGLCVLQRLALEEGEHKWKYKPIYCVLFPLTIYQNTLTIDDEHIDRLRYCNKFPISDSTIFDACKEELEFFFGKEGFEELLKYKEEVLSQVQNGVIADGNKK
jgi:Fe-S-cluster containining protein